MRFIVTSVVSVEKFKQEAKKLKRKKGIPHAEALDRVARQHNYNHWGHVTWCAKETKLQSQSLPEACFVAISAAQAEKREAWTLEYPETTPLLIFSTEDRDAWLLDPFKKMALCLCWRNEVQPYEVREDGKTSDIDWDTDYTTTEDYGFSVKSTNQKIGTRLIFGYPINIIEELENQRFSPDVREIFMGEGAEEITDVLVEELVQNGMPRERVEEARAMSMAYSRPRKSFLGPVMTDEDFSDEDNAKYLLSKDDFIEATGGFKVGQSMSEFEANEREKYSILDKIARGKASATEIARLDQLRGVDDEE